MNTQIIVNTGLYVWIYLCLWFAIISVGFSLIYFGVSLLIKSTIELEGAIRTQKVWREAINDWVNKQKHKYEEEVFNDTDNR